MYTVQHFIGARWHVDLPSIIGRGVRLVAVSPAIFDAMSLKSFHICLRSISQLAQSYVRPTFVPCAQWKLGYRIVIPTGYQLRQSSR